MTKKERNMLIGAAVVVGAIYLYRRNQSVASSEETSSFLGLGRRRGGRRMVRAAGGMKTCKQVNPQTGQIDTFQVPAGQPCPNKAEYRRKVYGALTDGRP